MRRRLLALMLILLAGLGADEVWTSTAHASGTWVWPIVGAVTRGYDPPGTPYGSGHRGIDIGAPQGTPIHAPAPGRVTFSGKVGGALFLTIDHGGGVASTYSWASTLLAKKGDVVAAGDVVALSGFGHPGGSVSCLHFGVKLNGGSVATMDYLGPTDLSGMIRLAPLQGTPAAAAGPALGWVSVAAGRSESQPPRMTRLWGSPSIDHPLVLPARSSRAPPLCWHRGPSCSPSSRFRRARS